MGKNRFFDEQETMEIKEREGYILKKLKESIERAYRYSIATREMMDRVGIKPSDINSIHDLEKIPITRKIDVIELQKKHPPFGGLLTIPEEDVDRVFITPGPIYLPHQTEKISWFGKSFYAAGFRKGDVVINTPTYHMSPAGLLFHEGIRATGATVIPTGVGNTDAQIKTLLDLKATGFAGMPSFLMAVIKRAEEMGYDFKKDFNLKRAWFTGEMLSASLRKTLEETYGIDTYQCYSVTELGGCVAYECHEKKGMHFMDDYCIEIVDPESGRQLKEHEVGEIVATPIHNPVWGLIRFGTGDMTSFTKEPCPCGRTSFRITGIVGRKEDAAKVRGMFVVAKQVEEFFSGFGQINAFQLVIGRKEQRDELCIRIELKDESIDKDALSQLIKERFPVACRVRPDTIEILPRGSIKSDRKTIIDERRWD